MSTLIKRALVKFERWRFTSVIKDVFRTAPVTVASSGPIVLSMVHTRDVAQWLVAVKSFTKYVPAKRIVMVADPSITESDIRIAKEHIKGVEIFHAIDTHIAGVPRGGCWERLCAIARLNEGEYVIQVDADTVAVAPLLDVQKCVSKNQSFVMVDSPKIQVMNVNDATAYARTHFPGEPHVQIASELSLETLGLDGFNNYIRGCAGFCGFAIGTNTLEKIKTISAAMESRLGKRWSEWGTEQFASNLIVANSKDCLALPNPIYANPDQVASNTVFIHFIGFLRFTSPLYRNTVKMVLTKLAAA
jgi:hypothetical protein